MQRHDTPQLSVAGIFYRNRDEWIRTVTAEPSLSLAAKSVGCYLAVRVNRATGDAFPQQTTMAKEIGVSRATVMRAVAELVAANWIEKDRKERGRKRAVNRYSLVMPWVSK